MIVFSANDYLGVATHPEVVGAAAQAALADGVGSTGSRHLSACHDAIDALESELCAFLSCPAATVAPSGHAATTLFATTWLMSMAVPG